MPTLELPTENLRLVLQTPEQALAAVEAMDPADRAEVSPDWLARLRAAAPGDPWAPGFAAVHRATGDAVGACAFKGPPDADGAVEIAYAIDPAHRGRGYATEAARALAAFALGTGRVRVVRAHTRSEPNASTRVLTRCGFTRLGEVTDPEDGPVWRWELRADAGGPADADRARDAAPLCGPVARGPGGAGG